MKETVPVESARAVLDARIKELKDWRGKTLARVREIIHEATRNRRRVEVGQADIAGRSHLFLRRHRLHWRNV